MNGKHVARVFGMGIVAIAMASATAADQFDPMKVEPGQKLTTADSGLKYVDLKVGKGEPAKVGQLVMVNYDAWLANGTRFDSSYARREPFRFKIGAGQVIQGWDEGVVGMRVGGKRKLIIPPGLGYGEQGAGDRIPPNSTLVFEIELLELK
jgi:FKBP-type peptidyl-prolyl cis-trans isomerase